MSATVTRRRGVHRNANGQPVRIERRRIRLTPADIRAVTRNANGLPTSFTAIILRYMVIDDYGTRFVPGVFDASMSERMPRICWAHDWANPLGRWVDVVRNDNEVLELRGEFDDFDDVPDSRRAASQLNSGTIDQFSVGFYREEDREADDPKLPGIFDIVRGDLVEGSLVLVGAVPGTATTGFRDGRSGLLVPVEDVERIIVDVSAGNLDVVEAIQSARDLAEPDASQEDDDEDEEDDLPAAATADPPPAEPVTDPTAVPPTTAETGDTGPGDTVPQPDAQTPVEVVEALAAVPAWAIPDGDVDDLLGDDLLSALDDAIARIL